MHSWYSRAFSRISRGLERPSTRSWWRYFGIVSAARAQKLLYRFRICVMEIREKLRPRARDRYLVVPTRNFEARNLFLPRFYFFSSSHLPRVSLFFPRRGLREDGTGVCERTNGRARARARIQILASAQVQYPWMSVDLVTHTIVKRGLNSNPSRAAGRGDWSLAVFHCRSPRTDLRGDFLSLHPWGTNVVDETGKQSDPSSGMALATGHSQRGGGGAVLPLSLHTRVSRSLLVLRSCFVVSLPFCFFSAEQAVTAGEALKGAGKRRDAFSQGVRGSQQRKMRFSKRGAESEATAERRFWTAAGEWRESRVHLSRSFSFSLSLSCWERRYIPEGNAVFSNKTLSFAPFPRISEISAGFFFINLQNKSNVVTQSCYCC